MNIRCLTFAALCCLPCALTVADDARVTIPSFKALEATATDTVKSHLKRSLNTLRLKLSDEGRAHAGGSPCTKI